MKFLIQKNALVRALNNVSKAVSSSTTLPILTGIKMVASHTGIELTGSNSNITICSFIPAEFLGDTLAEIQKEGSVVLPAKFFSEIVKKLPKDDITIETDEKFATKIKSGKAKFQLNGLDSEEYPRLPAFDKDQVVTMKSNELKRVISETAFAVSTNETRPVLTGVHWEVRSNVLIATATDSHRLARKEMTIKGLDETIKLIIPGKSLTDLNKILEDNDDKVKMIFSENQVYFHVENLTFYSRLLEGNYPETSRLIPTEHKTEMVVDSKELIHAIDRATILAKEGQNNVVRLDLSSDDMFIKLSSVSREIGDLHEDIMIDSFDGENLAISFNAKFLKDALQTVTGNIKFHFVGSMRPFIFKAVNDDSLLHLLLPVRTY